MAQARALKITSGNVTQQDPAADDFTFASVTSKSLRLTSGTNIFIESADGSTAAVSAANEGRLRYNSTTQTWQVSMNGAAYADLATGGSPGWTDDGTNVRLTTAGDTVTIGTAALAGAEKTRILGNLYIDGATASASGVPRANIHLGDDVDNTNFSVSASKGISVQKTGTSGVAFLQARNTNRTISIDVGASANVRTSHTTLAFVNASGAVWSMVDFNLVAGSTSDGAVRCGDGTATIPAFSYVGETTTGHYLGGAGLQSLTILGTERFRWDRSGAGFSGNRQQTRVASVQTADATVTSVFSFTLVDNTVYWFEAMVVARGTAGVERAYYIRQVRVHRQAAGAATLGTINVAFTDESSAALDATFTVSGNDLLVSVTGIAATTINWTSTVRFQGVSLNT